MKWISELQAALEQLKVRGLDFYRLDPDWVAFKQPGIGSWRDVEAIHMFCRSQSVPFSLIYWASDYPEKEQRHLEQGSSWIEGVMTEGAAFAALRDPPEQFVVESWVEAPARAVPDSNPDTFTGSVLELARRVIKQSRVHR
jgi:hypothetical protein